MKGAPNNERVIRRAAWHRHGKLHLLQVYRSGTDLLSITGFPNVAAVSKSTRPNGRNGRSWDSETFRLSRQASVFVGYQRNHPLSLAETPYSLPTRDLRAEHPFVPDCVK